LSHGTCSYIHMYIHAVADSVMLCLQHDFCNIIFKIEHKFYIATVSTPPPPPQGNILGAHLIHVQTPPNQCERTSHFYILITRLQYLLFVTLRNVGPPLHLTHRHARVLFSTCIRLGLFVCLFVRSYGVKHHGHRTEWQNNSAFLATSYQSVIEGRSCNLVYKASGQCAIIISSFEIFLLLGTV
jgi:hypothetical protein